MKRRKTLFPSVNRLQIASQRTVQRGGTTYTMDTSAIEQQEITALTVNY
jgi:hypothetical protein